MNTVMEEKIKQAFQEWKQVDKPKEQEMSNNRQLSNVLLDKIKDNPGITGKALRVYITQGFPTVPVSYVPALLKGFYDNMLPKEVGKYVKQFGGKVEKADMTQSVEADIMSGEEAETGSIPIWKVNITPEMRKISQTGQMRFMPEGKNAPKSTKISAKQQQSKTSAISRIAVVNEDEEQSRRKARRSTAKGNASAIANAAKLK
jgi:predicted  nucleic acid-binding Zn ribbon protein